MGHDGQDDGAIAEQGEEPIGRAVLGNVRILYRFLPVSNLEMDRWQRSGFPSICSKQILYV